MITLFSGMYKIHILYYINDVCCCYCNLNVPEIDTEKNYRFDIYCFLIFVKCIKQKKKKMDLTPHNNIV